MIKLRVLYDKVARAYYVADSNATSDKEIAEREGISFAAYRELLLDSDGAYLTAIDSRYVYFEDIDEAGCAMDRLRYYLDKQRNKKNNKEIIETIEAMYMQMEKLNKIWEEVTEQDQILSEKYPFERAFEDLVGEVEVWKNHVVKKIG